MDTDTFLNQVFSVIKDFHQLTPHFQMISILTLCISAWKVSAFRPYWDKLGWFKTFFAPACSFLLAIVNGLNGPLNIHTFVNALMIGMGSVGFHEILDAIKTIPHIGPKWLTGVNVVSDLTMKATRPMAPKHIQKALVFFALCFFSGCGQIPLKPDPTEDPVLANYPTAEFVACGKRWQGLGICPLHTDVYLDTIDLQVKGYFDGDIRVFASSVSNHDGCQMDQHFTYRNSELVSIKLPKISASCTFSITVSPHFPNQDNQSVVQPKSLPGFLRVRKLKHEDAWYGTVLRDPENASNFINVPTTDEGSAVSSIRGCGISFDGHLPATNGNYFIDLNQKGFVPTSKICTLEGVIFGDRVILWSALVGIYSEFFVPLAQPVVSVSGQIVSVYADTTVSAIFLDDQFILANHGIFIFDPKQMHVIRVLTAGGRSRIGEYDPNTQGWVWL